MENAGLKICSMIPDMYGLFTFEPLHNLHLSIYKVLREKVIECLSSYTILNDLGEALANWRPLIQVRKAVFRGCNAYYKAIAKHNEGSGLRLDFSRGHSLSELDGLFTGDGLRGMIKNTI